MPHSRGRKDWARSGVSEDDDAERRLWRVAADRRVKVE
ncbi:unnamed protein product [Rhodiola kirilowii]